MRNFIFGTILMISFLNLVNASNVTDTINWHSDLTNVEKQQSFIPIGNTLFSIFVWDVYKSKLLTTSGVYPIQAESDQLIYEIEYLKGISSKDLILRTIEQWQHIGVSEKTYIAYLPELKRIWPNIESGDTLTLVMNNQGSAFYYNKQIIGEINQPEFGPIFLDIWLSENTSEPTLRSELLGIN